MSSKYTVNEKYGLHTIVRMIDMDLGAVTGGELLSSSDEDQKAPEDAPEYHNTVFEL